MLAAKSPRSRDAMWTILRVVKTKSMDNEVLLVVVYSVLSEMSEQNERVCSTKSADGISLMIVQ